MTFPEASKEQEADAKEGNIQCERETKDKNTVTRSARDSDMSDHGYMTFHGTENAEDQDKDTEHRNETKDKDTPSRSASGSDMSDHGYMTFPGTENAEDQDIDTKHRNDKGPDPVIVSVNENNSLDHAYVKVPNT
uniref:Uncharacterized protein n=1 Tax=Branchiostoma floridae TaxID=7739 RepID=C3Z9H5_BRAFL|eukprot:XP_002594893.1 hypothetical protein BRAFLDRAFT_86062 [Branchiostoma floridae]